MNKLALTHNNLLTEQLKKDFEAIQQPFPKKSGRSNRYEKQTNVKEGNEDNIKVKKTRVYRHT